MKKIITLLLGLGLLGACVTTESQEGTTINARPKPAYPTYNLPSSVDKAIKGLEGCTKEFAFEVMGLPSGEKTIDGKKYFEWDVRNASCVVNANINNQGLVEKIYYQDTRKACEHMYVRIINYYRQNPAQSAQTCPNRTDLQGNHRIQERKK